MSGSAGIPGSGVDVVTFLLASGAVIGLAVVASRWLGTLQTVQSRGRRMKVLEGVPIGKDRNLLLVAVGKEVLVVGSSAGGVNLVHRMEESAAAELLEQRTAQPNESGMLVAGEVAIRASLARMRSLMTKAGASAQTQVKPFSSVPPALEREKPDA